MPGHLKRFDNRPRVSDPLRIITVVARQAFPDLEMLEGLTMLDGRTILGDFALLAGVMILGDYKILGDLMTLSGLMTLSDFAILSDLTLNGLMTLGGPTIERLLIDSVAITHFSLGTDRRGGSWHD
jgi:hypothetical protein